MVLLVLFMWGFCSSLIMVDLGDCFFGCCCCGSSVGGCVLGCFWGCFVWFARCVGL